MVTGQKVWTTWAPLSDHAVLLARTAPDVPQRRGITYFLLDLRQPGVEIRPLRHLVGEAEFNEVFLDGAVVPDDQRVGAVGDGWKVAGATLSGERQMVAGSGSGGVDRIGGSGADHVVELARRADREARPRGASDPVRRQQLAAVLAEERIRAWTNRRVRDRARAGLPPGTASSLGKVHQGELNQRTQLLAADLLGSGAAAWEPDAAGPDSAGRPGGGGTYAAAMPYEVRGMLRSRANTIEGGTTEVNKNIVGERVLGLPREPDPWAAAAWSEVPRS